MAIKFLSGQTIDGTLTVSGNVQGATFNGYAINTTGTNNVANQIVRTQANGYANFGWINSISGNHTGSITRITASNDAFLRYVTPAQFRTGVTDGYYAPVSTVSGVTSVATTNGITGGTIISTGTIQVDSTVVRTTGAQSIGGVKTFTDTITSTKDGIALQMDGGASAEGIRMTADSSTTYPTFLRSINPASGESSPWIYQEASSPWGIWHNNPINTFDFTRAGNNLGLENNVGGETNSVMIRLNNTDGKGTFAGGIGLPGTTAQYVTGTGALATFPAIPQGDITGLIAGTGITITNATGPVPTITNSAPNIVQTSVTGNAGTATTFSTGRTNYKGVTDAAVIGQMMWKNYGNNHTIFDASASTSPQGGSVNNTNSTYAWTAAYPTLMGWNGSNTYGVRVDSARIADSAANQGDYVTLGTAQTITASKTFSTLTYFTAGESINLKGARGTFTNEFMHLYNKVGIGNPNGWGQGETSTPNQGLSTYGAGYFAYGTGAASTFLGDLTVSKGTPIIKALDGTNNHYLFIAADATNSFMRSDNNLLLQVDGGNVTALTFDNVGSATFSGYTYFPNYLFHAGDTNTRIQFTTGTITLRGDSGITLDGPTTTNANFIGTTATFSGTVNSTATVGFITTGSYAQLRLTSTSSWSYIRYQYNAGVSWDVGSYQGGNYQIRPGGSGTNAWLYYSAGYSQAPVSSRAPLFYDSNNTAFYADLGGTISLNLAGRIQVGTFTNSQNNSGEAWIGRVSDRPAGSLTVQLGTGSGRSFEIVDSGWTTVEFSANDSGVAAAAGSFRAPLFYDSNNTVYYADLASNSNSINIAGSLRAATYNKPGIISVSSGTTSAGASIAIQQETSEGWTAIFADFEPNTGWGLYHDNPSNHFLVTSESSSGAIGAGFTVPSRVSGNRTAYTKQLFDQTTGDFKTGRDGYAQGSFRAPIFYDTNNTAFYLDPSSTGTSLNVAGDVVAYASSDIRFKNNVTPITNALDKINKIGGYTFEWNEKSHKETGKKDIGVIAQEVEEILPEIVDTRDNGYKAVDYSKLTALLIQSVKEQQVIIDNLKSRIETLENN